MATWLLSAEGQLVNLANVEYFDVLDVFAEDAPAEAIASGELDPAYSELVGFLASGHEIVLFEDEDAEAVMHAFELLKGHLASPAFEAVQAGQILSVQDLIDRAGARKN